MNDKCPKKLNKCPLREAIFEIRYEPNFPSEAVFGVIYAAVKDLFPKDALKTLPIQQIPEQIRLNDENFKYQAWYSLVRDNMQFNIGPNSLTFINTGNYSGWVKLFTFFSTVLKEIKKCAVIKTVERIGLRYINVFQENILANSDITIQLSNLKLADNRLLNETTNLRTELIDSGFVKVLQIGNSVDILSGKNKSKGSIIDIDCIYEWKENTFFDKYIDIINIAHTKEKQLFFSLLKEDFMRTLNPEF